jgi:glycosyltransferase involved in cell wall biosynthesis
MSQARGAVLPAVPESQQKLRILHVSSSDMVGGAARATYRLHLGLRRLDCDSRMFVRWQSRPGEAVTTYQTPWDFVSRLRRRLRRGHLARELNRYASSRPDGQEFFSDDRSEHGAGPVAQLPLGDIVNLHWVAEFVDMSAFLKGLPRSMPVVWTLHDMNLMTGGCHYDGGCGRFTHQCGRCPQLGSAIELDLSRQIWQRKLSALASRAPGRLAFVANSDWLANEARRSTLLGQYPVRTIHYGLDTHIFRPGDRMQARAQLDIPQQARVVLFVADSIANRRKGFSLLCEALAGLAKLPDLFLVSLGYASPELDGEYAHRHLGHVGDDQELALIYNAADVFVIPSLEEAFGQTALEAQACGIPTVGFAVGGIPDIIQNKITGLLAPEGDIAALRNCIAELLFAPDRRADMGTNGRRLALEQFSLKIQARPYLDLYQSLARGDIQH